MFSELVDDVCVRVGRSNNRTKQNIISYTHATMKECQLLEYFDNDLIEDQITVTASPYTWTKPASIRYLRTVRYPSLYNEGRYPELLRPGKKQREKTYFYYAGPNYYVFAGVPKDSFIDIAYYTFFKRLAYHTVEANTRPAVYDRDTETWTYLDGGVYVANLASTELETAAQEKVSNWLLLDWKELIEEGVLAKVYKMLREDKLAGISFQAYKSFQKDLLKGAATESLGY